MSTKQWMIIGVALALFLVAPVTAVNCGLKGIENSLPATATIQAVNFPNTNAYFDLNIWNDGILNGQRPAWCIDETHQINIGVTYCAEVYSSYESLPSSLTGGINPHIDNPENLDLINWIINQNFIGQTGPQGTITSANVQNAIWNLIDDAGCSCNCGVGTNCGAIVAAALDPVNGGEGFVPGCGDKVAIIIVPVACGTQTVIGQVVIAQVLLTELGISCDCDDGNACTTDICDETTGICDYSPLICGPAPNCFTGPGICDTTDGICDYSPLTCGPAPNCFTGPGICDTTDGICDYSPLTCGPPGFCEVGPGICDTSDGLCDYQPFVCDSPPGECYLSPGVCDLADGSCDYVVDIGAPCGDNGICLEDGTCEEEEEPTGCTYTQGYWKTHTQYDVNKKGKSKEDPTWNLILPDGEDTEFFLSGQSWYEVFQTAPSKKNGGAYYSLAHQYMAAVLNTLKPDAASTTPDVDAAMTDALVFFNTYTPTSWQGAVDQSIITGYADTLEDFNSGSIGPGHCGDEAAAD
ncbi:MAG: hypothetical protein LUO91_05740 [Methanomicrobiales archaeon]|nr:hypothetical protein [Methanomicrobiales archaeon]